MATTYKVLGQSAPVANTDTTLYTVPSSTQAVCSTLVICNSSDSPQYYRVAIRPNGETLASKHYIAFDTMVLPFDSSNITIGISMDAADVVTVRSSSADLSFNLFGTEIT